MREVYARARGSPIEAPAVGFRNTYLFVNRKRLLMSLVKGLGDIKSNLYL